MYRNGMHGQWWRGLKAEEELLGNDTGRESRRSGVKGHAQGTGRVRQVEGGKSLRKGN